MISCKAGNGLLNIYRPVTSMNVSNIITKSIRQETNASIWLGVIPSQDTNLLFSLAALAVTPYLPCNLATSPLK